MDLFDRALQIVLSHEGGYSNDPDDPGGETIFGISRRAHPSAWEKGRPTKAVAAQIYRQHYWVTCSCDRIQSPVAIMLFDTAVNMGPYGAIMLLQSALRVKDDGIMGPITLSKISSANIKELVQRYAAERISYYSRLTGWRKYGLGWTMRTISVAMECEQIKRELYGN